MFLENKNSFLGMFKKYIPAPKNKNDDLKNKRKYSDRCT